MSPSRRVLTSVAAVALSTGLIAACSSSGSKDSGTTSPAPTTTAPSAATTLGVAADKVVATLDERYSSYNIEMVTVTGGEFWAPYGEHESKANRPPIDLASAKLRNLAKALGPAYVRVSGTWANEVFFDPTGTAGETPPEGFNGVLTGDQWKGVGDFAKAVDGEITTSYPSTPGARDANGVWLPAEARKRMEFSKANQIPVVAAELFNESNLPIGFPAGYDAADFIRDFGTFTALVDEVAPDMKIVGPSVANDINPNVLPASIKTKDMLEGMGSDLDVFSYHFYPKSSKRCGGTGDVEVGLTPKFLDAIEPISSFYSKLRDTYAPKAPIWVTETGQAQCGGDPWASGFVDVVRFADAMSHLATHDGNAVFHNTLVGSDYAYLAEGTFETRPNYWAAVLWHRLMGPKVLQTTTKTDSDEVRVHAQCTPGRGAKGASYVVINTAPKATHNVGVGGGKATIYQLTGPSLAGTEIDLNGMALEAADDGTLPEMPGKSVNGPISLPPASVTYVVDPTPVPACS